MEEPVDINIIDLFGFTVEESIWAGWKYILHRVEMRNKMELVAKVKWVQADRWKTCFPLQKPFMTWTAAG